MSKLTLCNYCSAEIYRQRHEKVVFKPSVEMPGWTAVVIDGKEVGWFMELPNHCVC